MPTHTITIPNWRPCTAAELDAANKRSKSEWRRLKIADREVVWRYTAKVNEVSPGIEKRRLSALIRIGQGHNGTTGYAAGTTDNTADGTKDREGQEFAPDSFIRPLIGLLAAVGCLSDETAAYVEIGDVRVERTAGTEGNTTEITLEDIPGAPER